MVTQQIQVAWCVLERPANVLLSIKTFSLHSSSSYQQLSRAACSQPYVSSALGPEQHGRRTELETQQKVLLKCDEKSKFDRH